MGARERARELSLADLSDAELIVLVLGTGTLGEPVSRVAAALLDEHGGLDAMARAGFGQLAERKGLGEVRAMRLAAAFELGRRVAKEHVPLPWVPDSRAVHAWSRRRFDPLPHEELWVLAVDGQNRVRAARRVAVGGLHGLVVSVRDPLRFALREGASAIIAVHNHPSGDPAPSYEDLRFTEQLALAAEVVGTPLLDHVIVAGDRHRSMLDDGVLSRTPGPGLTKRGRADAAPPAGGTG